MEINLKARWQQLLIFSKMFVANIVKAEAHVNASYLAYVTLMSLVPLILVMFSMMTAFPIFGDIQVAIEDFVYQNLVPTAGDVVHKHLSGFVANASKMSAITLGFLFLFALLLISAIDHTLNKIWGVTKKRRVITAFSTYWMVLTLGPLLVGASLAATSYIISLVNFSDTALSGAQHLLVRSLPLLASTLAFLFLYMVVPNKEVRFKHAIKGAIFGALFFELAKKGFALYITLLPSYEAIYGALATIPILFAWVYLSWLIVLLGALFTVTIEQRSAMKIASDE
ncbi:virulence factor BrkB family protein [Thalassotalea sp. LPB0316]|uniref:virulence factor BrkB family protein n=1 Tax=Thalassotalea sp. LPB0316 TaxID=2769490 RepID=UPI001867EA7E|nr:virulence factor BrkB family protein [Thalassotalea sp. LPB0316]QOL26013.1 virulence factor BrkB family protein [Thalassotalea sp. LPB0316]